MAAKQGQRYRILPPPAAANGHNPTVNGKEISIDKYVSTFKESDGTKLVLVDLVGDVIKASDNVDYPRGPSTDYRHVDWINEHPDRFELVEDVAEPEETE